MYICAFKFHSSSFQIAFHWIFDRLEISVDMIFSKAVGREIPMLCIIDDGCGMNHQEVLQMVSFGHRQPDADDPNRIGRFGIGFKVA